VITVFGSINLDVIFRSEALPHPGQTVLAASMRTEPGGEGANQALPNVPAAKMTNPPFTWNAVVRLSPRRSRRAIQREPAGST
jgi:hypothetical protein